MGAGASSATAVTAALAEASAEDLAKTLKEIPDAQKARLLAALSNSSEEEPLKSDESPKKSAMAAHNVCIFVIVDIKEDRVADFLMAMEQDAKGSRAEEGCQRFDLLKNKEKPNQYVFYEVYNDDAAVGVHKTTGHYKAWADFKASGGVENQAVAKCATTFIPGDWALQPSKPDPHEVQPAIAVIVTVDIKEEAVDAFLAAMETDVKGSRDKEADPGCLRFDLMRSQEKPNQFVFFESYVDDDALNFHKTTDHYKAWADFKAGGTVEKQEVMKLECATIGGGWAFQGC